MRVRLKRPARGVSITTQRRGRRQGGDIHRDQQPRPNAINQDYDVKPDPANNWQFIATATEHPNVLRASRDLHSRNPGDRQGSVRPITQCLWTFPLAFNKDIWNGYRRLMRSEVLRLERRKLGQQHVCAKLTTRYVTAPRSLTTRESNPRCDRSRGGGPGPGLTSPPRDQSSTQLTAGEATDAAPRAGMLD